MRAFFIASPIACVALCNLSCGGSGPTPREADREPGSSERSASAGIDEQREAAPADEPPPRCTDGSCFPCGEGYCLAGFFCDEEAVGGATCGWLPACGGDARCPCLEKALIGCRCEAEDGAIRVRCEPSRS